MQSDGALLNIFELLNADADMESLSIHLTSIKAHQHSTGAKKGL